MNWKSIFEHEYQKNKGATIEEIDVFLKTWNSDLTTEEIAYIKSTQRNPFPKGHELYEFYKPFDPLLWRIPKRNLPSSFIEFLKYSNGGDFQNGGRYFQFFGTSKIREMMIAYNFPQYMEYSISFAIDGCGNHYVFDMRKEMTDNEYPILAVSSGNLGYDDCKLIGSSFLEVCAGRTDIDEGLHG